MIQFHLSKAAAEDLKQLVEPAAPINYQAMQWYLHRVTVARRKCIVAMEQQSRYALVFCGLTKKEFAEFPQLFSYWFALHALACMADIVGDDELMEQHVLEVAAGLAAGQTYQLGSDRSVNAHIRQVVDFLKILVEVDGYPLPVEPRDTAMFLMRANDTLYRIGKNGDWFRPVAEFSQFWMGLFDVIKNAPDKKASAGGAEQNLPGQVIHVDFSKRVKR
jgi:hypothetical protein